MAQLEQYRIFAAVAQNKSFCKAAEALFISQPAVSQSIKQLEKELDTQLFIRNPRGVLLTEAGEILYSYVERGLSIFKGAENHINQLKTLEFGTLNIGASDTLCQHFLLKYFMKFHEKYPSINLTVTNRTSKETVSLLKQGKVDMGFVNMPTEVGEHIVVRPLTKLHDCFVYNEKHFPLLKKQIDETELLKYPLLMLERESSTRRYVDSYFKDKNVMLSPQIQLGSHDLLLSFADIGLGVAAVVREYSQKYLNSNSLKEVKLKNQIPPRTIALIYQEKIPLTFSAKEFIKILDKSDL